jgi:ELWxxDGT repeat protein
MTRLSTFLLACFCTTSLQAQPWAQLVKDVCPGACNTLAASYHTYNGKAYFLAEDNTSGAELWVSDGTTAGTQMLMNINPDPVTTNTGHSSPLDFTNFNGLMLFTAQASDAAPRTPWVSDGTPGGTVQLSTIEILDQFSPDESSFFMPGPGFACFFAKNALTNATELWATDGTPGGTQMLQQVPNASAGNSGFTVFNNKLYIAVKDEMEMWITDGTPSGTTQAIIPYPANQLFVYNNMIFFYGGNGMLSATDGSVWGSSMGIAQMGQLGDPTRFRTIKAAGSKLFAVDDKLWVSDGTPNGKKQINTPYPISSTTLPVVLDGNLYFTVRKGVQNCIAVSDGTEQGTYLLDTTIAVINNASGSNRDLFSFQTNVYFEGRNVTARTPGGIPILGKSSLYTVGISSPIKKVADITTATTRLETAIIGNELLLSANDSISGVELWKLTDFPVSVATSAGTGSHISLYPNPAQDHIALQLPDNRTVSYQITNLYGQVLQQGQVAGRQPIEIAALLQGVYFMAISGTNGAISTKQFVKQ